MITAPRLAMVGLTLAVLSIGSGLRAARADEPAVGELAAQAVKISGYDRGLCLVIGETDGALTAALAKAGRMHVQGCTWDAGAAQKCRQSLVAAGVADRASIMWIEGEGLPYADNLVYVIVAGPGAGRGLTAAEIFRVLAPGGLALVRADMAADASSAGARDVKAASWAGWIQFGKAADPAFDVWTQNLGGPDQSYVNDDKAAGPWSELRWIGEPRWGALGAIYHGRVTAGGRLYYNENRAAVGGTEVWLVARDAWNGAELWRVGIGQPPKYGNIGNTLTCDESRVFCVENNRVLTARDGKTGRKLLEYSPGFTPTVAASAGPVILTCDRRISPAVASKMAALDKDSGKPLWTRPGVCQPAADSGTAFVLSSAELEAVELISGASRWKVKAEIAPGSARVFCKAGVVYTTFTQPWKPVGLLVAYEAKTGRKLWKLESPPISYGIYPYADELWMMQGEAKSARSLQVLDPRTGTKKRELAIGGPVNGHCFPGKGAGDFLLFSNSWWLNLKTGESGTQHTVRAPCGLGQMPANGLTYFLPQHCSCGVTLRGLVAMSRAGQRQWLADGKDGAPRLFTSAAAPAAAVEGPEDWPFYRKDAARSNFTTAKLPTQLKLLWSERLGASRLTQAAIAYGIVCTSEPQTHRVFARDAADGKPLWSFVADGRTEWTPALTRGLCIFSTGAGSVYALDARTGKQVWRLRAAPAEKYIAEEGQFASAWPVVGGVLPQNGEIFFSCGRSSGCDGGMWIFAADAATGKVRWRVKGGSSGDLFLSNGNDLMLTRVYYSPADGSRRPGGKEPPGLLRTTPYLTYLSVMDYMGTVEPLLSSQKHEELTDGRITGENLAFNETLGVAAWRYRFGVPKEMMKKEKQNSRFIYARSGGKNLWLLDENITQQMVGVVLAGQTAYLAGLPTSRDPNDKAELWVLSALDGKRLQTLRLDSRPVYDGLSAAAGRLYLVTEDGQINCYGN